MEQLISEDLLKQGEQWLENLPDEWKIWLTENIERGCSPDELVQILQQNGLGFSAVQTTQSELSASEVVQHSDTDLQQKIIDLLLLQQSSQKIAEQLSTQTTQSLHELLQSIEKIKQSPLFIRLQDTTHQLHKREWLLASLDKMAQLNPNYHQQIPKIVTPPFKTFIRDYYSQHRPVILTKGVQHWAALKKWTPEYFAQTIGDGLIEIQMGRDELQDFERQSPRLKHMISMREYVEKVLQAGESNNFYMTANNSAKSQQAVGVLYADMANFGQGYCDLSQKNSLSFIWFGPKGTFTPLHHDLTNNMLLQIYGRKKVTLIPAIQTPHLYNDRWVFSQISDPKKVDLTQFPHFKQVTPVECVIGPGEALFIPMGWWHTVESLDVSISVSFTHFNAPNQFVEQFPRAINE